MNLLKEAWIPVQQAGLMEKITLQQLLCNEKQGELCLPRDDMEFACLQLLVAITQVLFPPADKAQLVHRLKQPLTQSEYADGCEGKLDWFDLDHPETPFMQFKNVKITKASETSLDKLLPGLNDGQNKVFVNPNGLSDCLCSSCAAIALYHYANNCPNMGGGPGGGIKAGLRGNSPLSTLVTADKGIHREDWLRSTIWLNILTSEFIERKSLYPLNGAKDIPNYIDRIAPGSVVKGKTVGLYRGLLWTPVRFELVDKIEIGFCSLCGVKGRVYRIFRKEPFGYDLDGYWPHPYSPVFFSIKKGVTSEYAPSLNGIEPPWTLLGRFITEEIGDKSGYSQAPVILQAKEYFPIKLGIAIGGYRSSKAMIENRCFEIYSMADGWGEHAKVVKNMIDIFLLYKEALRDAVSAFCNGREYKSNPDKSFKGIGVDLVSDSIKMFYQQSERYVHECLSEINFDSPGKSFQKAEATSLQLARDTFEQVVLPYKQEPKMLVSLACSRRIFNQNIKKLITHGGNHE